MILRYMWVSVQFFSDSAAANTCSFLAAFAFVDADKFYTNADILYLLSLQNIIYRSMSSLTETLWILDTP